MDDEDETSDEIENYKIDDEMLNLLKLLDVKSQKNVLNEMVEKIEYIKLKNGDYKEAEALIQKTKEKIDEL